MAGRAIRLAARDSFTGRMIELGCGGKEKGLLVGDLVDEHIGIDLASSAHSGDVRADVYATIYGVPFSDGSFDCALSTAVLEHLERPQAALREARRVLKPGAPAVFTAPLYWHLHEEPRDFFRYTRHGLAYLFDQAGFENVSIQALSGFWVTYLTELGYYLGRFRKGAAAPFVKALVAGLNLAAPVLDSGPLRDERFTWMYLVCARAPGGDT